MKPILISALLATIGFCLAAARINPGLVDSSLPAGPGLTTDESFNINQGVYAHGALWDYGPTLNTQEVAQEVFGDPVYLPDHPPWGRMVLGAAHQLTSWMIPGAELSVLNVPAARLGSCFAFAAILFVLSEFTRRRYGLATAIIAALFLLMMPRVVGHARIAAQETPTTLAWLAAVIPLLAWWTGDRPPSWKHCFLSGCFWGILMATKVQGILLPPLIVVWSLWHFRWRAIGPLALWGITGGVVFFLGWPWLWIDPVANLMSYFVKTSDRPTIYVWYLGQRFSDKAVPWHFPFVMTAITVPAVVLLGLACRLIARKTDRIEQLLMATSVWPLMVFALPGTPVYDATRLYLVIMPGLALLAARGAMLICASNAPTNLTTEETSRLSPKKRTPILRWAAVAAFVVCSAIAIPRTTSAFAICDYNVLVGGPKGAESLGMEASYWADGLNGDFWEQVPENSTLYVAPVCHQFQLSDWRQLVPQVRKRNITLKPFLYDPHQQQGLMLTIHRLADLRPALRTPPADAKLITEVRNGDVVLARLFDTTDATWPDLPDWPAHD